MIPTAVRSQLAFLTFCVGVGAAQTTAQAQVGAELAEQAETISGYTHMQQEPGDTQTEIGGYRTRYHFAGEVGFGSAYMNRTFRPLALGGAICFEFGAARRLRPLLDLSYLYASGKQVVFNSTPTVEYQYDDLNLYTGFVGLRAFTGKEPKNFHLDFLLGANLPDRAGSQSAESHDLILCTGFGVGWTVGPVQNAFGRNRP